MPPIKMEGDDMNKRTHYFINRKFQTNFIFQFCLLIITTGTFITAVLYVMARRAGIMSFVNSRAVTQNAADFLLPLLIQALVVSTIILGLCTVVVTLFVSHRIVGPIYRFKKVLDSLGEGDFSISCDIRKKDTLKDVALAFNGMIYNVGKMFDLIDKDLKNLKGKLETGDLAEIRKSASEVDRDFHHFKF